MAKPSAFDSLLAPNPDLPDGPASAGDHERQPSPPIKTVDPKVFRSPSQPTPQERDPRLVVKKYIENAPWLKANTMDPNVGDDIGNEEATQCAAQLVGLGCSFFKCFIIDIKQQGVTKYECIDTGYIVDRLDRALGYQRSRKGHTPFLCPKGW